MQSTTQTTDAPTATPGRFLLRLAVALAVLPILVYAVQFALKYLREPWYIPILSTGAALCLVVAFLQRRSIGRLAGLILVTLLAAGEWYFLLVLTALPGYGGPVAAGQPLPRFQTERADGTSFGTDDLHGDQATVLTFFRGRW